MRHSAILYAALAGTLGASGATPSAPPSSGPAFVSIPQEFTVYAKKNQAGGERTIKWNDRQVAMAGVGLLKAAAIAWNMADPPLSLVISLRCSPPDWIIVEKAKIIATDGRNVARVLTWDLDLTPEEDFEPQPEAACLDERLVLLVFDKAIAPNDLESIVVCGRHVTVGSAPGLHYWKETVHP